MRKILLLLIAMIAVTTQLSAKAKVVKNPWYDVSTTPQLQIDQLELSDTATVMRCTYYSNPGWWFIIAKGKLAAGWRKEICAERNAEPETGCARESRFDRHKEVCTCV